MLKEFTKNNWLGAKIFSLAMLITLIINIYFDLNYLFIGINGGIAGVLAGKLVGYVEDQIEKESLEEN